MARLFDAAILDCYVRVADEVLRCLIVCMDKGEQDHRVFLEAAFSK